MMNTRTFSRGFTLMELMITVVIIGILASVAIPNYTDYVAKSRRAEAQSTLLQVASWMERYFTENNRYDLSANAGNPPTLPTGFTNVPQTGTAYYTITIATPNTTTYTVTATRAGSMASDRCGDFTYTQANVKNIQNNTTGSTAASCWGQ
jgi:type IV pilus assembly protein PilE